MEDNKKPQDQWAKDLVAKWPVKSTTQDPIRTAFEKAMNAKRFFPRELDFSMTKSPSGRDEYVNAHLESEWIGWQAALEWRASSAMPAESVDTPEFQAAIRKYLFERELADLIAHIDAWGAQQHRNGYAAGYDEKLSLLEKRTEQLREAEANLATVQEKNVELARQCDGIISLELELVSLRAQLAAISGKEGAPWTVGNLMTLSDCEYPGMGAYFKQVWDGDDLVARVYGNSFDEAHARAQAIAGRAYQPHDASKEDTSGLPG